MNTRAVGRRCAAYLVAILVHLINRSICYQSQVTFIGTENVADVASFRVGKTM